MSTPETPPHNDDTTNDGDGDGNGTPPDELGSARAPLTAALALGRPMRAAGDAAGAHEVYSCAARLVLGMLAPEAPIAAALQPALDHAGLEPAPEDRAEILQALLLDFLGEPFAHDLEGDEGQGPGGAEADPLDRIHGRVVQAISIGAPAFNQGLVRGCYEVYAATARLILSGPAAPDAVRRPLESALAKAGRLRDERQRAWAMRDALDEVLDLRPPAAGPDISGRDVRVLISMAVQIGAPAYNLGDHRGCYEVYATTARLLLQVAKGCERERDVVRDALQRAAIVASATEQAWVLRRAFDAILNADP